MLRQADGEAVDAHRRCIRIAIPVIETMRIEELIDFYNLSNYNSFSSAANDLYTSRYNLMRNITNLENDLGVKLFQRRSNGIYLTPVGKEILGEVGYVVEHYNNMIDIANSTKTARQVLKIGCYANNSTTYAMMNIINMFNISQGDYTAEYVSVDQKDLITMLRDREIDFAFTTERSKNNDLQSFKILRRDFFAIVNNSSDLASRESVLAKDIMRSSLVIPQLTGGTERVLVKQYGAPIRKNIAIKSNDFYFLFSYISHNDCIGIFNSEDSIAAEKIFDNLVSVPISPSIYVDLCLITADKKEKSAAKKHFIEFVTKNYNKLFA